MQKFTKSILIVDDNAENLRVISKMLVNEKFTIRIATNGMEAIESVKSEAPGLILLDIQMPGIDGYETCRRIKSMEQFASIPILFISALSDADDIAKAFKVGGQDYITKPFREVEVLARVKTHAKMYEYQQSIEDLVDERTKEFQISEQKFKALIAASNTGAWIWYADAEFLDCTKEYFSMLGRNQKDFDLSGNKNLKETWIDLLHPDDRDLASKHFADYLNGGSVGMYENTFRMLHKNGNWIWIWSRGATIRDDKGELTPVTVGTHIDITKQKEDENALKLLNNELEIKVKERTKELEGAQVRLNSALKSAKMGNWEYIVNEGVFSVSESINEIYGFDPEEEIDLNKTHAKIHPDDLQKVQGNTSKIFEEETQWEQEYRIIAKNGEIKWIFDKGKSSKNKEGKVDFLNGVISDISSRKKVEEELVTNKRFLEIALEAANMGSWKYLVNENKIEADKNTKKLYGLENVELTGNIEEWFTYLHEEDIPKVAQEMQNTMEQKQVDYSIVFRINNPKEGLRHIMSIGKFSYNDDGTPNEANGVVWDITDIKVAEEEITLLNQLVHNSLEAANIGAWWIDFKEENMAHGSDNISDIIGITKLEDNTFKMSEWNEILDNTKKQLPQYVEQIDNGITKTKELIEGIKDSYTAIYPIILNNGTLRWIDDRGVVTKRHKDGTALFMTGTFIDVTEQKKTQEKVIWQNTIMNALINSPVDILIFSLDNEYKYTAFNKNHFAEMKKVYNVEIEIGMCMLEAITIPDVKPLVKANLDRVLKGEGYTDIVYQPHVDIYYEFTWNPIKDTDNNIIGLSAFIRDITERKKSAKELEEAQYRLTFALKAANMGAWNYDIKEDSFILDDTLKKMFGFEEHVNVALDSFMSKVHPDDIDLVKERMKLLLDDSTPIERQYRIVSQEGEIRWVESSGQAFKDEKGNIDFATGIIADITEQKKAEEEISKLSVSVEQSPVSIIITDLAGNIEYVNPVFYDLTGYTSEEVLGKNPRFLSSGMHDKAFFKNIWDTILSGKIHKGEICNRKKNGELYWEMASISPLKNDNGDVTHFVAVKEDITERRKIEAELENERTFLQNLLNSSPIGVAIATADTNIQYANDRFATLYGLNEGDKALERFVDQKDAKHIVSELMNNNSIYAYDSKVYNEKNEIVEVLSNYIPIEYKGKPSILSWIVDISDLKKIENELFKAKQKAELAIDAAKVGIWDWDMINDILIWDDNLYNLYGINSDTFSGAYEAWTKGLHPDDKKQAEENLALAIKEDKEFNSEFRIVLPDKTIRYARGLGKLFKDESGKPERMIGVNWDITDWKSSEEELLKAKEIAEEATAAKSSFLASMSHEIRTPMNAVIGLSHLALQTDLSPKQYDYLNKIQSSGKALLGIINDILDFSKIEAGKLTIEDTNFDLEKVFNDVATVITYKAHEKGLEVVFNIDQDIPLSLIGDPLRIGQILINLANNAVKFTNEGEILIHVEVDDTPPAVSVDWSEDSKDTIWLRFSVKDTGIGIKKNQVNKLFESFTQADRSTSRKYGGTGLGLAICKNLVEMMDGVIRAESEYGKGSTFIFNLKLRQQKDQKQKVLVPSVDLRKMKVLVCDDNPTSLEVLTSMLQSFTFQVKAMLSGEEALAELEKPTKKPYELVILDWKMPGMDGIEVAARIKVDEKLAKIPTIIMVTAYTREQVIKKVDEMELAGLLTKPVSHSTMFDTIMEAFGKEVQQRPSDQLIDAKHAEKLKERKGARILLVEDNDVNQQVATEMIEAGGFIVEIANNGLEAINRLNKIADFDLVFMDLQMPVMDGVTASEKLRKDKDFDHIPIVAMTADVVGEVVEQCMKIGMNDFVAKPISPESVFEAIIKWIKPGKRNVSKLKVKTQVTDGQKIEIPELEGINIDEGLNRVNGNKKLYQNLLLKFYDNNINLVEQLKKAYEMGNEETALQMVHTIKGVSGNIGANDLHFSTKELERKLKDKEYEDLNTLLDEYCLTLKSILDTIEEYKNSLMPKKEALKKGASQSSSAGKAEEDGSKLDKELFEKLLEELTVFLEDNDMDASGKIEEILELPGLETYREQIEQINTELENYDFDAAIDILNKIQI